MTVLALKDFNKWIPIYSSYHKTQFLPQAQYPSQGQGSTPEMVQ